MRRRNVFILEVPPTTALEQIAPLRNRHIIRVYRSEIFTVLFGSCARRETPTHYVDLLRGSLSRSDRGAGRGWPPLHSLHATTLIGHKSDAYRFLSHFCLRC